MFLRIGPGRHQFRRHPLDGRNRRGSPQEGGNTALPGHPRNAQTSHWRMGHHAQKRLWAFRTGFQRCGIAWIRSQPRREDRRRGRKRKGVTPWERLAHGLVAQHAPCRNILARARPYGRSQQHRKPGAEVGQAFGGIFPGASRLAEFTPPQHRHPPSGSAAMKGKEYGPSRGAEPQA